jgi:hypothetical protein
MHIILPFMKDLCRIAIAKSIYSFEKQKSYFLPIQIPYDSYMKDNIQEQHVKFIKKLEWIVTCIAKLNNMSLCHYRTKNVWKLDNIDCNQKKKTSSFRSSLQLYVKRNIKSNSSRSSFTILLEEHDMTMLLKAVQKF